MKSITDFISFDLKKQKLGICRFFIVFSKIIIKINDFLRKNTDIMKNIKNQRKHYFFISQN